MTTEITDEMVEQMKDALAELFNQRLGPEDAPYIPSDFNGLAEDELTAVLPIIEQQVRAAWAEEVRDLRSQFHDDAKTAFGRIGSSTEAYLNALDDVLALLEGGAE